MVYGMKLLEQLQFHGGKIIGTTRLGAYNKGDGTINITSGIITGATYGIYGEAAKGTITMGDASATLSTTNPCVQGNSYYGVGGANVFYFYNGVIKGIYQSSVGTAYNCSGTVTLRDWHTTETTSTDGVYSTVLKSPIGDYIYLGNNIVGTEATTDDWRILYVDEETDTVYAILADYLPNSTGYTKPLELGTTGSYQVYSNTDRDTLLTGLTRPGNWVTLANGIEGATVTGSPTADLLINSYNTKNGTNLDYKAATLDSSTEDYDLYVPHVEVIESCYGYWLATPSTSYDDFMYNIRNDGRIVMNCCIYRLQL